MKSTFTLLLALITQFAFAQVEVVTEYYSGPAKVSMNDDYYFVYQNALRTLDESGLEVISIKEIPGAMSLEMANNSLFIGGFDGATSSVWKSNGTEETTVKLKDVADSYQLIHNFIDLDSIIIFQSGKTIWKSDGTIAGTSVWNNFFNKDSVAGIEILKLADEIVAYERAIGRFWKFNPRTGSFELELERVLANSNFYSTGNEIYFSGNSDPATANNYIFKLSTEGLLSIWQTSDEYSTLIKGTVTGNSETGTIYFLLDGGKEIWMTNGTVESTVLVVETTEGMNSFSELAGNKIIYADGNKVYAKNLFSYQNTLLGYFDMPVRNFATVGETAFIATTTEGLWKTDGSQEGTVQIQEYPFYYQPCCPAIIRNYYINNLTNINNSLYYTVTTDTVYYEEGNTNNFTGSEDHFYRYNPQEILSVYKLLLADLYQEQQ